MLYYHEHWYVFDMRTLVRLFGFAKKHWKWLLAAFLCLVATNAFSMAVPLVLRTAVDDIIAGADTRGLTIWAIAIIAASVLRGVFAYGQNVLAEIASQKTAYDIRNALYDRLQRQSFTFHDDAQTGQLMSRATADVEAVRQFFSMGIIGILRFFIISIGISVILVFMSWQLALISFVFMLVIGSRAIYMSRRMAPVWLKVQQLIGNLGNKLEENLTGVVVVKAFSRQREESQEFSNRAKQLYDKEINVARHFSFNMPLMVLLMTLPIGLTLWYGGRQVIGGSFTPGELTAFIFYLTMMALPVRRLGFMVNQFSRSASAGQRILEILDAQSSIKEKPNAIELEEVKGRVCFEKVYFKYASVSPVLENASFVAEPGEVVALVGASGSGKSTIANIIPRFYDVSSGRVTVDGIDIRDVTLTSLRKNIGMAQQDTFLFSATIKDNIAYSAVDSDMDQIVAAAKAACIHDYIQSLPKGYDTWVGERGVTLSGGEKQRLSIARTLLKPTPILILDDSTSSVDADTEYLIRQALRHLMKGRTTFVITHRLPIIKSADCILVLAGGQIVEQGKHSDLMSKNGVYHQLYEMQLSTTPESGESSTTED